MRMTLTALPITSARRFSPRGPLGIFLGLPRTITDCLKAIAERPVRQPKPRLRIFGRQRLFNGQITYVPAAFGQLKRPVSKLGLALLIISRSHHAFPLLFAKHMGMASATPRVKGCYIQTETLPTQLPGSSQAPLAFVDEARIR